MSQTPSADDRRYAAARRRCLVAWFALLALLAATAFVSRLHLGSGNLVASAAIAAVKAAIVVWVFMALREASALVRLAMAVGCAALALLASLSLADFLPRRDEPTRWQPPQQVAPVFSQDHRPATVPVR